MKRPLALFLLLFSTVVFTGVSIAQEASPLAAQSPGDKPAEKGGATKENAKKPRPTRISGEVISVDASAKTVTVKTKKKDIVLNINDKTKITSVKEKGKKEIELSDLKSGDRVTAAAVEEEGKVVARAIRLSVPMKAKKGTEAKTKTEKAPGGKE